MESTESKSARYQLKKQAVFDVLYKCCERNKTDQVSLASVLQYISKELGSNFKSSENIVNELNKKLKNKSEDGWISFTEVCEILSGWMDNISLTPQCVRQKKTSDSIEYSFQSTKSQHPVSFSSPVMRKNTLNDVNAISGDDILFSKCDKCGRDENCCEWRSSEMNREENITRRYELKVTELQNLLRQSEDCNSVIQLENESLQRNNAILQSKEQRWISKEEELAQREQQLSSANMLLKEQNDNMEKEILNLKQKLIRAKIQNEKMASENILLEERIAEISRIEKLLCEAKLQQSQMQINLDSKDVILTELEAKLEQLQEYNEVLEAQISDMQKSNFPNISSEQLHEKSLGEELMIADISTDSSLKSIDVVGLDIPAESSLQAELDACGHWPLLCEHVAVQATPSMCPSGTQTDGKLFVRKLCKNSKSKSLCRMGNAAFHLNETCRDQELVEREQIDIICASTESNTKMCKKCVFSKPCSDSSKESASMQLSEGSTSVSFIPKSESYLYVPFVEQNGKEHANHQYQSTYEMELFVMVDALTQTEPFSLETNNGDVKLSNSRKLSSERQSIPVNPHSSALFLSNSCGTCGSTLPSRNRICSTSQSSAKETANIFTEMDMRRKETSKSRESNAKVVVRDPRQLLKLYLRNALALQLLCRKQYGTHATIFCCNSTPIYDVRPGWWNTIVPQRKKEGSWVQCRVIQILIVVFAWYLFQTLTQLYGGHIWRNLPSFWSELHRVLSQKMELSWPRGPPPQ